MPRDEQDMPRWFYAFVVLVAAIIVIMMTLRARGAL